MLRDTDLVNSSNHSVYYKLITFAAPIATTAARIDFVVASTDGQSINFDDVLFGI